MLVIANLRFTRETYVRCQKYPEEEKMKRTVENKREREKKMVSLMIQIYCSGRHGHKKELCPKCRELAEYARLRSDKCPFMV